MENRLSTASTDAGADEPAPLATDLVKTEAPVPAPAPAPAPSPFIPRWGCREKGLERFTWADLCALKVGDRVTLYRVVYYSPYSCAEQSYSSNNVVEIACEPGNERLGLVQMKSVTGVCALFYPPHPDFSNMQPPLQFGTLRFLDKDDGRGNRRCHDFYYVMERGALKMRHISVGSPTPDNWNENIDNFEFLMRWEPRASAPAAAPVPAALEKAGGAKKSGCVVS